MKQKLWRKIANNEYLIEQQHRENKSGMQRVYDLEKETMELRKKLKELE